MSEETKWFESSITDGSNGVAVTTAPQFLDLLGDNASAGSTIPPGTSANSRIGDQVMIKAIKVYGYLTSNGTSASDWSLTYGPGANVIELRLTIEPISPSATNPLDGSQWPAINPYIRTIVDPKYAKQVELYTVWMRRWSHNVFGRQNIAANTQQVNVPAGVAGTIAGYSHYDNARTEVMSDRYIFSMNSFIPINRRVEWAATAGDSATRPNDYRYRLWLRCWFAGLAAPAQNPKMFFKVRTYFTDA